ncbi:MAG: hypothetical protein IKW85_03760 [Muribaculaceae bacterium]|nr:hypothetical protein [Muribaculaceae bacterium]
METKTPIRLTLALVMAMTVLGMTARSSITYQATYHQSEVTLGTDTLGGVTYSTVSYHGLYNDGAPGAPSLPVDYIKFSVPYNATNFSVSTTVSSPYTLYPEILYPCQPPRMMNDTTPLIITLPDSAIYYSNTYYPSQRAWVVDEGYLAGENHIVTVAVLPWQYKHLTRVGSVDQLKLHRTVNLTLSYDLSDSLAMYPIVRDDTTLRNEGYRLTQEIVVNGGSVRSHAPVDIAMMDPDALIFPPGDGVNGGFPPQEPRDSTGMIPDPGNTGNYGGEMYVDSYPYLIVTTTDLLQSTKRLAALKRQKGYNVKVVTMDEVLNSPYSMDGDRVPLGGGTYHLAYTDAAGKLRQYLRYHFKHGTKYVFLVGDVPYRYITIQPNISYPPYDVPSDLYFSDMNSDWSDDSLKYKDRNPELYVGRLMASDGQQVQNYTDKLLRYELNPGDGERSYLERAFFLDGRDELITGKLKNLRDSLSVFYPNQIYVSDSIGNLNPLLGNNVIDTIRTNPVGFVTIYNHGDTTLILVHGDQDIYENFIHANSTINGGNGLNCLMNKKYPMIFYALCCRTMPFDSGNRINFGQSFTIGKDYGGPVYIGYTREAYGTCQLDIYIQFIRRLRNGYYKLGEAVALSKMDAKFPGSYYYALENGYFGDPSVELWTATPQDYLGVNVTQSSNSISISGVEADSTIIGYYSTFGSYRMKTIKSSSVTIKNASPNRPIMVYEHGHIPYIVPMFLQNLNLNESQYVFASDVVAGSSVDSGRTSGDVIVKNGVEYEIEASGTVTLQDGFKVEKGAFFAVYPSSY